MNFTWDPAKSDLNLRERAQGIALAVVYTDRLDEAGESSAASLGPKEQPP